MVHHPSFYARILKDKITRHGVNCWLLNTGWVGGPYGIGKRISIRYTRTLLNALLEGDLLNIEYSTDPIFGFKVPKSCPGIPDEVLNPASSWKNQDEYMRRYISLASRFIDNMKKFEMDTPIEVLSAGPKI